MTTNASGSIARVICVGNRFVDQDDAGPRVYDYLADKPLPPGVEVVEGGLGGLNLLGVMEGAAVVVFVDTISGFADPGEVVVLDGLKEATKMDADFGHSGGLTYLLKVLPEVWEGDPPRVLVVGMEGAADESAIELLAETSLRVADQYARAIL